MHAIQRFLNVYQSNTIHGKLNCSKPKTLQFEQIRPIVLFCDFLALSIGECYHLGESSFGALANKTRRSMFNRKAGIYRKK